MLIRFINVGRDQQSWVDAIPLDDDGWLDIDDIAKSIRRRGAVKERTIGIGDDGLIYAGRAETSCRPVGRWECEFVVAD